MRLPNKELENQILLAAIELLMEKEPAEIGMRDVAKKCSVSATSIYNYYRDKNELFMKISLSCLAELTERMKSSLKDVEDPVEKIRTSLKVYRDWCFEKPKVAVLIFSKLEENIGDEDIMNFYVCNRMGENLLAECKDKGIYKGNDIHLDTGIIISGMWGCIESIITKRADPDFWNEGVAFTDRFIEMMVSTLIGEKL
ncbi:TetR/AcrR family transcriptional regulator [Treponema sp.]|uniref:TetR/AcrR family transcriptional regulator n=1 Tax=Treponema sp. TaxID=166 RepID=UPI00298E179C|nr:TetR/AcrR family transcriptional regulator [Treponema sp.]MCQ2241754.1 TetR/AcrR family transcriptional regulator [Treponema sp.]